MSRCEQVGELSSEKDVARRKTGLFNRMTDGRRKKMRFSLNIFGRSYMIDRMSRTVKIRIAWGAALFIILAGITLTVRSYLQEDLSFAAIPIATAQRGPLTISITESGTLQAVQSVTLASEITSNRAKVASLVPEGTYVQEGDLVIEFDKTPFEEEIRKLRNEISQAEASFVEATENSKLQRVKNAGDLKDAQVNIRAAEAELQNILDGEGVIQMRELELEVQRDRANFEQKQQQVVDLQEMLKSGFITQNELKNAELELQEAETRYTFTQQKHEIFVQYTRPAQVEKARNAVQESKEKFQELQDVANYLESLQAANLQKEQAQVDVLREKYQQALKELTKTSIFAPIPGLVIYNEISGSGQTRKIQVGDAVWSNQALISLPDISHMMVDTQVREIDVHKVQLGQEVLIKVDAYPDAIFHGTVSLIGSLAQSERNLPANVKYFEIQVVFRESDERLRPGMTARVEILVDQLDDALYVPLQAVFEKAGNHVCYIVQERGPEERLVDIGKFNDDFIAIENGISEGERLYLHDPTSFILR